MSDLERLQGIVSRIEELEITMLYHRHGAGFPEYVCQQLGHELGKDACSVCFRYVRKCLLSQVGGRREEALRVWTEYQAEKKEGKEREE